MAEHAFAIDPGSPVPPFEQLRQQVTEAAASGALTAGTRLPPVRQLATDLGLAANTVARTYRELETDGVIETRGRNGSFIAAGESPRQHAEVAASEYVAAVRRLGLADADALALIERALRP
jgi:DNA-binding transcriptional regulator YhcF (GntR family)